MSLAVPRLNKDELLKEILWVSRTIQNLPVCH